MAGGRRRGGRRAGRRLSGDPVVRLDAAERVIEAGVGDERIDRRLRELLDDSDEDVVCAAMMAVAPEPEVVERLFVIARDRRGRERKLAARLLLDHSKVRGRWAGFLTAVWQGPRTPYGGRVIYVH